MKKSVLLVIALFLVLHLSSCLFEEQSLDKFIIQEQSVKTIIFDTESYGYTNSKNFFITDSEYVYIGKEYNGRTVYKKIMPNRDFSFKGISNNTLFVNNVDGLQRIVFDDVYSNVPNIEEDVLVSYYLNGFDELIRGQNTNLLLNDETDSSIIDGLDPSSIIGFIKDAKIIDSTIEEVVYKSNHYIYLENQQLILRTTIDNDFEQDITDNYIDIEDEIKKAIFVDNYVYLITNNKVYTYCLKTGLINSLEFDNILIAKQIENKICVVTSNSVMEIYDQNLNLTLEINLGENLILGLNWYQDDFDSGLVYAYKSEVGIDIEFIEIN